MESDSAAGIWMKIERSLPPYSQSSTLERFPQSADRRGRSPPNRPDDNVTESLAIHPRDACSPHRFSPDYALGVE
jgi:hypothetical protein